MAGEQGSFGSVVAAARGRARRRVADLRTRYPAESPRQLGERLVRGSATRAGLAGAATGTLALFTFPVGAPAGIAAALYVEAELLLSLLAVYGLDDERGDLRLYALWAGAGLADAAKSAGLRAGAGALGRILRGSLPARIIARLNPALVRAILRRLGLGWVRTAVRLWPLLGAPVAFAVDRAAVRALGSTALDELDGAAVAARRRRPATPRREARQPRRRAAARRGATRTRAATPPQDAFARSRGRKNKKS